MMKLFFINEIYKILEMFYNEKKSEKYVKWKKYIYIF